VALRFNPPPSWPRPPAGWTPPPGWVPDPSWPPVPAGWQLWVSDDVSNHGAVPGWASAPAATSGPGPVGAVAPYGSPWGGPAAQGLVPPTRSAEPTTGRPDGSGSVFGRRRKQAENEQAQLRVQLEEALAELEAVRAEVAELAAERARLKERLADAVGMDVTERVAEVKRLRAQIAGLERECRDVEQRRQAGAAQEEAERAERVDRAERELWARLAADRSELEQITAHIREARQRLTQAQSEELEARRQVVSTNETVLLQEVGIYAYRHPLDDAVAYKGRLDELKDRIKVQARNGEAVRSITNWHVNGSATEGRRMVRDFSKLMLRAYNAEADYAVRSMRPHRLASLVDRLEKSRATVAKLGATMQIRITDSYHRLRVRELELTADHLAKQEEEKERRRELRERQREDEKLQREIERERARLAKEQAHYRSALDRLRTSAGGWTDEAAAGQLECQLAELDAAMASVDAREANIRAGYVYVISNVGAFGDRMVKIGLTRRLEPMDRVHELGDASVPFRFDVHALIFSEDAVGLERSLHKEFDDRRVNRVNTRREFFYVRPAEVREALQRFAGQHLLEFREEAEAPEWRASGARSQ
jgi:septal ring factor EnvC (AmiA/AmiB activator)